MRLKKFDNIGTDRTIIRYDRLVQMRLKKFDNVGTDRMIIRYGWLVQMRLKNPIMQGGDFDCGRQFGQVIFTDGQKTERRIASGLLFTWRCTGKCFGRIQAKIPGYTSQNVIVEDCFKRTLNCWRRTEKLAISSELR
ncbi:hypothetical protein [Blautia sp. XA-2221]|uniref:hypothetical protein n=1 Tax=Blautia sp. XA-2221 TaxID=2903961 RepID=UPI002378C686|nr:hypothetical protein [Blautia sp. XA-2221]